MGPEKRSKSRKRIFGWIYLDKLIMHFITHQPAFIVKLFFFEGLRAVAEVLFFLLLEQLFAAVSGYFMPFGS